MANFAPATLADAVLRALPPTQTSATKFTRLEYTSDGIETSDEQKNIRTLRIKTVVVNSNNGLFSSYEEVANNDIPFRINYKLTYLGLVQLKWQTIFLNHQRSGIPFQVRNIRRADAMPVTHGTKFEYHASAGGEIQFANLLDQRDVCTVGASQAARELHPALTGNALEVACENYGSNGQLVGKTNYAFLESYGFAVRKSFSDSKVQYSAKISSVLIH